MKNQLLSLIAAATLVAMAAPATAQSADIAEVYIPAHPCHGATVNDVQECVTYLVAYANRQVDNAQDDVEDVLDEVCRIVCNFVTSSSFAAEMPADVALACRIGTVNDLQACITYLVWYANQRVDDAQDEVEKVIDEVCRIVCNFVTLNSAASASQADVSLACGDVSVNGVQDCANWAIDTAEALACGATVSGLQRCANTYIDDAQDAAEKVLEDICRIVCNFVAAPELARAE